MPHPKAQNTKNTKEREVVNMFEKFLKRSNWTDITIAIVFAFLGILLIAKPDEMMSVISILLGAIFIIMGFLRLVDYFTSTEKEDYLLTIALIFMIIGAIILFRPNIISNLFSIVVGLWIILSGLKDFQTTLVWKDIKSGYWTATLICSMLMIIAGIAILVSSTLALKIVGIMITVYAILDIITRFIFMKKIEDYVKD